MCALGVRFLDENGEILQGCGENLGKISEIDVSGLDSRVAKTKFTVMCDVNNPLCGENGATYTFGPQKGGTPESLARLEEGMLHYRDVLLREFGVDVNEIPGAGAAGGLGAALVVFLNAVLKSGIETVLDLVDFDSRDVYKRQPRCRTMTKNIFSNAFVTPAIIKKKSGRFVSPTARRMAAP